MRHALLLVGVMGASAAALALSASACSSSTTSPDDPGSSSGASGASGGTSGLSSGGTSGNTSGGTSGSSGSSGTSGTPDAGNDAGDGGTATATTLKAGTTALVGVTSDGYAVYVAIGATSASLEVVPVGGGAATVLVPTFAQTDGVVVAGATVAYWTTVTANIGTLGYWTKATGPKAAVAAASASGLFFSNPDSTRIAFSVAATATSSDLAVTTSALGTNTPVLTGNNAINMAAATPGAATPAACSPDIGFVGKVMFAAYCTGTTATTTAARLVTVPDGAAPTPARLDTASPTSNAAATVQPFFSTDTTGTKIFVIDSAANSRGRIIFNGATRTEASLDVDTQDGIMLDDGTAAVFRVQNAGGTVKAIRRSTTVAVPVTTDLVATAAEGIINLTRDEKHVLYNTLPQTAAGLVDLRTLSTTPPPANATIVATAVAFPFGFTGDNTTVLYQTDVDANGIGKLKSMPVAGGTEKTLATNMYDLRPLKTGTGALILDNPQDITGTQLQSVDLKFIDVATATAPALLAKGAVSNGFEVSGTKLVYTVIGATGAGLFSTTIP